MKSGGGAGKARVACPLLAAGLLASASCRAGPPETVSETARRVYATPYREVWAACVEGIVAADLRIVAGWMTRRGGELNARGSEGSVVCVRLDSNEDGGTLVRVSCLPIHAARAAALLERIARTLRRDAYLKALPGTGEVGAVTSAR